MKKYITVLISFGLNLYGYFIIWKTHAGYSQSRKQINFFYDSDVIISSEIKAQYVLATLRIIACLALIALKKNWKHFFANYQFDTHSSIMV
jgi:hypothetical protein